MVTNLTEATAEEANEVQHFRAFGKFGVESSCCGTFWGVCSYFFLCAIFFKDSPFLMQLHIFRHHTGRLPVHRFLLCSTLNEESCLLISVYFFVKTFSLIGEPSLFYTATELWGFEDLNARKKTHRTVLKSYGSKTRVTL